MTATVPNGPRSVKAECADAYPIVAKLNDRWRVIACRHGIQWILQYRNRAETVARDGWRGRSYCRTKEALIRVCDCHAGNIEPAARAILNELPDWSPEKQNAPGRITGSVSTYCARRHDYTETTPDTSVYDGHTLLGYLVAEKGHWLALSPDRSLISIHANQEAARQAINNHLQEASKAV